MPELTVAGKAAELAGYSVQAFVEILNKHGISVFRYSPEELDKDLQHVLHSHQRRMSASAL